MKFSIVFDISFIPHVRQLGIVQLINNNKFFIFDKRKERQRNATKAEHYAEEYLFLRDFYAHHCFETMAFSINSPWSSHHVMCIWVGLLNHFVLDIKETHIFETIEFNIVHVLNPWSLRTPVFRNAIRMWIHFWNSAPSALHHLFGESLIIE